MIKKAIRTLLAFRGYRLVNYPVQRLYDFSDSGPLDTAVKNLLLRDLAATVDAVFQQSWMEPNESLEEIIREFLEAYGKRPFGENIGGSLFHNAFWLYITTRVLRPNLVIESGVWRGQTTWLFRQAAEHARIYGFDINLAQLEVDRSIANFVEADWSTSNVSASNADCDIVFFDDHVDQCKRLIEAADRGFKLLLFDDNFPIQYSYIDGGVPAVPTVDMAKRKQCPRNISFLTNGRRIDCKLSPEQIERMNAAADLIQDYIVFPDVGGPTRFGGFAYLTLVRLK